MASTGKSRWGSLLSQAVAGVEARLDTILAENEEQAAAQKTQEPKDSKPSTATSTRPASPSKPSTGRSAACAGTLYVCWIPRVLTESGRLSHRSVQTRVREPHE